MQASINSSLRLRFVQEPSPVSRHRQPNSHTTTHTNTALSSTVVPGHRKRDNRNTMWGVRVMRQHGREASMLWASTLEAELAVQVLNTGGVLGAAVEVAGLEQLLELLAGGDLSVELLHGHGVDGGLDVDNVVGHGVAGGHDVVVVDELDEGLHAAALEDLLLGHGLVDGLWGEMGGCDGADAAKRATSCAVQCCARMYVLLPLIWCCH